MALELSGVLMRFNRPSLFDIQQDPKVNQSERPNPSLDPGRNE